MQNIIATLLESQLESFSKGFLDTSRTVFYNDKEKRLIHNGEFGMLREACVRELLKNFLPNIYGVAQGYVIGQNDEISHQCDLIIYHKSYTPYFHTPEEQRFFPIESVIAVGEIKSKVDGTVLDDALEKLANIKLMREAITDAEIALCRPSTDRDYAPKDYLRDQVVTFIVCEEFTCSNEILSGRIKKSWADSLPRHRVNLICAIRNGTCTYKDGNNRPWMYPIEPDGTELPVRLVVPAPGKYGHIALFLRYLIILIEDNTVLYPELTRHLNSLFVCSNIDIS
ncbi:MULTISPECIES: DUF6602 domain-containing protein [Aeromonas]|uniref:DUF6602 domain-containing protein n=1 Tax=Aeromonas TaxID=642 RepID=UPI0022EB6A56|nr:MULTISPECIES: DUF6602 domain-containing protein [Aeromonas]KAJ8742152.1 hypothetical protein H9Y13_04965 [Aeromonas veronii]MDA3314882.1 hypothetical protein [Aeromonas sp. PI_26]